MVKRKNSSRRANKPEQTTTKNEEYEKFHQQWLKDLHDFQVNGPSYGPSSQKPILTPTSTTKNDEENKKKQQWLKAVNDYRMSGLSYTKPTITEQLNNAQLKTCAEKEEKKPLKTHALPSDADYLIGSLNLLRFDNLSTQNFIEYVHEVGNYFDIPFKIRHFKELHSKDSIILDLVALNGHLHTCILRSGAFGQRLEDCEKLLNFYLKEYGLQVKVTFENRSLFSSSRGPSKAQVQSWKIEWFLVNEQ